MFRGQKEEEGKREHSASPSLSGLLPNPSSGRVISCMGLEWVLYKVCFENFDNVYPRERAIHVFFKIAILLFCALVLLIHAVGKNFFPPHIFFFFIV